MILSRIVNDFSNIRWFYRGKTKICVVFYRRVCVGVVCVIEFALGFVLDP